MSFKRDMDRINGKRFTSYDAAFRFCMKNWEKVKLYILENGNTIKTEPFTRIFDDANNEVTN